MGTILNPSELKTMQTRIAALKPDAPAQWGKMNVNEMLCHLADQMRMAFGEIPCKDSSNFFTRNIVKRLILMGMSAPRGRISTAPELDQAQESGTRPTDFEADRRTLLEKLDEFVGVAETYAFQRHPAFGALTKRQWAKMIHGHMAHHLTQFGV